MLPSASRSLLHNRRIAVAGAAPASRRRGKDEGRARLRQEIRAGDAETRTLMRELHEDVIGRIAVTAKRKRPR